jgi:uncharacterized protein (TIGR03437 family)
VRPILLVGLVFSSIARGAPAIKSGGVVNSADQSDASTVGLARGGLLSIYGSELAPREVQASSVPLPTTLSSTRVKISVDTFLGVRDYYAPLHYVSPGQINAVLPSVVPEGAAELRVVVSLVETTPVNIRVVNSRFTPFTRGGFGFGPAVLQQYRSDGTAVLNRFQAPARAGDVMVLWGTGLGPVPGEQDAAPVAGNLRDDVTVRVGGIAVKPLYAGRAPGLPGVDQINFSLPEGLSAGCFVRLVATAEEIDTGTMTLALAADDNACVSGFGLSPAALAALDNGEVIRAAVVSYEADTARANPQSVEAWVAEYDAASVAMLALSLSQPAGCEQRSESRDRVGEPPLAPLYGLRRVETMPLLVRVSGDACAWPAASGTGVVSTTPARACQASSVDLRISPSGADPVSATAGLPAPRALTVRSFAANLTAQPPIAAWDLAGTTESDRATLAIGSSFTLPGNIFGGATQIRELRCRVAPGASPFTFPRAAAAWALGLPVRSTPTVQVAQSAATVLAVNDREPGPNTIDLVLLRATNGVSSAPR